MAALFEPWSDENQLYLPQSKVDRMRILDPNEVKYIIVHCTDTSCTNSLTIKDINGWHLARGFVCIGYHFVIRPDGALLYGRPVQLAGAHAVLYNKNSIGVAYVGGRLSSGAPGDSRTFAQKVALCALFGDLIRRFPSIEEIVGHNDVAAKMCPCFNAKAEYANFVSKYRNGENF